MTKKQILINAILEFSGDEFETDSEKMELYNESELYLIRRLIHITEYYREFYNNN